MVSEAEYAQIYVQCVRLLTRKDGSHKLKFLTRRLENRKITKSPSHKILLRPVEISFMYNKIIALKLTSKVRNKIVT